MLPEESMEAGAVAVEAEQGAPMESPGVTRRRREMQAFAAARRGAPPPPVPESEAAPEPAQERPLMLAGEAEPQLEAAVAAESSLMDCFATTPVPYDRLFISSDAKVWSGKEAGLGSREASYEACYLLDEDTKAPIKHGPSKWCAGTRKKKTGPYTPATLEIKVSGQPIRLAKYALKSANDCPDRDPKLWDLIAVCPDGSERVVHAMGSHDRKWSRRWQWREWPCNHDFEASCFRLRIQDNHGLCGTQLGQLALVQFTDSTDSADGTSWLGKLSKRIAAAWAPEQDLITVDAPQGTLGLVFARDSTVISKIKDTSPLLGKVEIGWTLVSINSNGSVLDVTGMTGFQTANLLGSRALVERKLQFKKTPAAVAPIAVVGEVIVEEPGAEASVKTPEAAQIFAWQHPEAAALGALRHFFFTELTSLDGDSKTITKAEFAACCADPAIGPQISNHDAVFDCLDVDGSGEISFDELLYAVAGRYMADTGPGTKEPVRAWREVITSLSEALAEPEAQGKPMTGPAAHRNVRRSNLQQGHSTGVKCYQYVAAFLFPCYIGCTARGKTVKAVNISKKNKLVGMEKVMEYVIACKEAPVEYYWSIQNYHVDIEYYEVWVSGQDGKPGHHETRSRKIRVNTAFHETRGNLVTTDATLPFHPNQTKANVALKSVLDMKVDPAFWSQYLSRMQSFYASNTSDEEHDWNAKFRLKPMKKSVHVAWVETPTPCYVNRRVRNLMALTPLTAPVWLMLMDRYMCKQKVTFTKTCSGFADRPQTPKKLRDIASLHGPRREGGAKADAKVDAKADAEASKQAPRGVHTLRSWNYPQRRWRVADGDTVMIDDGPATTLRLVPGLYRPGDESCARDWNAALFAQRGAANMVSFVLEDGTYLRNNGPELCAHHPRETSFFRLDATFYAERDRFFPGSVSFHSVNYNGYYISHGLEYVLKIQDLQHDLHRKNACFVLEKDEAREATVLAALAGGLGRLVGR